MISPPSAKSKGFKVIIAGAGGAAHLPGMTAAMTPLPVFGVPIESKALSGQDSLLSIVQMPAGIPVGTLAIGKAGAINAALLAASVLALGDPALAQRLDAWRARQSATVAQQPEGRDLMLPSSPLPPGAVIGIIGGGQLGRMLALAAAQLGFRCHIFAPENDSPAFQVAAQRTVANYTDYDALRSFAGKVDVVTYEFENVPAETAAFLAGRVVLAPGVAALQTSQDRVAEKTFISGLGLPVAPFAPVSDERELEDAIGRIGRPSILKTRRFGYDGKGQTRIDGRKNAATAWAEIGRAPAVLEGFVTFDREISVIAARGWDGEIAIYDVPENHHENHILRTSTVPAGIAAATAKRAREIGGRIIAALDYVGVIGIETLRGGRRRDRQRDCAPGPQLGPLDHGRLLGFAVRAAHPGHLRLAAGQPGTAFRRGHDQPAGGRGERLADTGGRTRHGPSSLWQGGSPPGPENGPFQPRDPSTGLKSCANPPPNSGPFWVLFASLSTLRSSEVALASRCP